MDATEAMVKLFDYAKELKTWEEIVTPSNGQNYT